MGWIKGHLLWVRSGRESSGIIIVLRRELGTAVRRNRLKRRLRSVCREVGPFQGSLIILPQLSAVEIPFRTLREELQQLVSRLEESCS